MSKTLHLGTTNPYKVREIASVLVSLDWSVKPLALPEIEETEDTFMGNALLKARAYAIKSQGLTLAEDSGMCVDALNGLPGVYSARFSQGDIVHGEFHLGSRYHNERREFIDTYNNDMVLNMMQGVENRKAKLVIALAVVDRDGSIVFQDESILSGSIAYEPKGLNGFGYDPIFIADKSYGHTLAEIDGARKNMISHRKLAMDKLYDWAESYN